MHQDYKMLLIDIFNTIFQDKTLKQQVLTLIVRFFSEKTEFIRNVEKMMLVFNKQEWFFYKWANDSIDDFTRKVDKSALWLKQDDDFDDEKYINSVLITLSELYKALYSK